MTVTITYAGYGVWNSTFDVTQPVQNAYNGGTRTFFANNEWAGDPYPHARKYLFIIWQQNGTVASGVVGERDDTGIALP